MDQDQADAIIGRSVNRELHFKRVAATVSNQLRQLEIELQKDLAAALARLSARDEIRLTEGNFTTDRLKRLLEVVKQRSAEWTAIVKAQLESPETLSLVEAEIEFERQYLATFAGDAAVGLTLDANISARQIITAARRRPLHNQVFKEAFPTMTASVRRRITQSLRTSYMASESIGQAMTRLRSDQELGINRRGAEGFVRTGLAHYSHHATRDSLQAMGVTHYQWHSTLDFHTTSICRSLDSRVFAYSNPAAPTVPRHFQCRSTSSAWLGEPIDGERPSIGADGVEPVEASLSYNDWLRRQPKAFQRQVLGATQFRIFDSGVSLTKFTDKNATRAFTAAELRQRYSSLFD